MAVLCSAEIFLKTGFSRLPIYEGDLDHILGVLNQKDFHNYIYHKEKTVSDFIKPVVFVAESMNAAVLLKRMQKEKCQIAIVVDEYGGTTGLVAMEDILEELVGEIYDEHEEIESQEITKLQNGSIGDKFSYQSSKKIYEGRVTSADERKALEINLKVSDKPEEDENTES